MVSYVILPDVQNEARHKALASNFASKIIDKFNDFIWPFNNSIHVK